MPKKVAKKVAKKAAKKVSKKVVQPTAKKVSKKVSKKPTPKPKASKRKDSYTWTTKFRPGDPIKLDAKSRKSIFKTHHIKQIYFVKADEVLYMTISGLILREHEMEYDEEGENCFD